MSETRGVKAGQVYISNEDKKNNGSTRTVTIERTVSAKRVYDKKNQLYAVGISRIDSYPNRPSLVGKKRRVFIKVKSLLSAQYSLAVIPAAGTTTRENTTIIVAHGVESHLDARNVGHGHVNKRPDGHLARCGGPGLCGVCSTEKSWIEPKTAAGPVC